VLIQDKWREVTSQPEVGQFLQCADRISSRLPKEDKIYLIWCSKKEPTSFSLAMLLEKNVNIVVCGTSIENLARLCILQICDCLNLDPLQSLISIKGYKKTMDRSNIVIDLYDDTEDKKSINGSINKIYAICLRIFESIQSEELKSFVQSFLPRDSDFSNYAKVDFNFFCDNTKLKLEQEIEEDFKLAFEGIKQLPVEARFGVYVAYIYYQALLRKIKKVPASTIKEARIRVPNKEKFALLLSSWFRFRLNVI
jgi:hypothetical protein